MYLVNNWIWSGSTAVTDENDSMSYYSSEPEAKEKVEVAAEAVLDRVASVLEVAEKAINRAVNPGANDKASATEILNDRDFILIEVDGMHPGSKDHPSTGLKGKFYRAVEKVRNIAVTFLGEVLATGFGKWWDKAGKESTTEAVGGLVQDMTQDSWFSYLFSTSKS